MINKDFDIKKLTMVSIFVMLAISNIILFGWLIKYFIYSIPDFTLSWSMVKDILAMTSTLIIFGFISTRLPQFRSMGHSFVYEASYLIILGILGIVISLFNKTANIDSIILPYLEIFEVLSFLLVLVIIASKTKAFKSILNGNKTKLSIFFCILLFGIISGVSTFYFIPVNDSMITVRELIVMISGLFGGPYVGIPVAIIASISRYSYGGTMVLPAVVSTIITGFIGGTIHVCNGNKFLRGWPVVLLMFLYAGFSLFLVFFFVPEDVAVHCVCNVYPLTVFELVMGMVLFIVIVKEQKYGKSSSSPEERINELEESMDEYESKINKLEKEIELLKNGNDK